MSSRDPMFTGTIKMPPELLPKPSTKSAGAAAPTPPAAPAAPKPTTLASTYQEVYAICSAAQAAAFPDVGANVACAASDRPGVDYQNNSALQLFGLLKKGVLPDGVRSPRDCAAKLAEAMRAADAGGMIANVEVAGAGFINIQLSTAWLSARVHTIVQHGVLPPPVAKKRVIVDFSSPNVAKEMHVGHLRSTIIGDCICRVLEFCGHDVDRVNHVGDWGTQFGMLIAHLKDVFPDFATKPPPIGDLQQFYKAAKKVFDDDEAFKERAHEEVVRLQGGDGPSRYAWQQICDVSRREFEKVYSRLDVKVYEKGESFYNEYIPAVIAHLEQIGLVTDKSGAKVLFPPNSRLEHPLIVQKSDGGFGYDSTDVTAVWYRLLERRADWVIYVTDAGQGPHFELIFETARAANWGPDARLDHTPFGLVQRINHCATAAYGPSAGRTLGSEEGAAKLVGQIMDELNAIGMKLTAKKMVTDKKQVQVSASSAEDNQGGFEIEVSDVGNAENAAALVTYLEALGDAGGSASHLGGKPLSVKPHDHVEKYKTRSGETVRLVDLLDEAVTRMERSFSEKDEEAAAKGMEAKGKLSLGERAGAAKVLGYAAIKYADLKGNRESNYVFTYDRMLDKKGNTAVYLLYASSRMCSILRDGKEKHGVDVDALLAEGATVQLVHETELALGKAMLRFQEVVERCLDNLLPSALCEYLYDLCNLFTKFYVACKVLGSPEMNQRLLLLAALVNVLRTGYGLIGIGFLEKI